jgi:hypothetical protein
MSFSVIFSHINFSAALTIVSVLAVLTIITGIVGATVDGITWNVVDHLRACYDPSTDTYYGDSNYYQYIPDSCSGFTNLPSCLCVQTGQSHYCFTYDINHRSEYDCEDVLDYYDNLLGASTWICVFIVFAGLVYAAMLCTAGCNNGYRSRQQQQSYQMGDQAQFQRVPAPSYLGSWNNNSNGNAMARMTAVPTAEPVHYVQPASLVETAPQNNTEFKRTIY